MPLQLGLRAVDLHAALNLGTECAFTHFLDSRRIHLQLILLSGWVVEGLHRLVVDDVLRGEEAWLVRRVDQPISLAIHSLL